MNRVLRWGFCSSPYPDEKGILKRRTSEVQARLPRALSFVLLPKALWDLGAIFVGFNI